MSETCETVVIKTENGPVVINKSDLTDKHVLYSEEKPAPEAPKKRGRPAKAK